MSFDPEIFRAQFPIFDHPIHGHPLVYLDSAASAQKPRIVIDRMKQVMETGYANVHRGLHTLSNVATSAYEEARISAQNYLNAASPDEIIFTMGGTDAVNLVANSFGQSLTKGDEIILSVMEHHSNIVPWHLLRERKGIVLKWLDVDSDGNIDLDQYKSLMTDRTRLVALTGLSNVLGAYTPIKDMARIAHNHDVKILIDGCQYAVHGPVDVQDLEIDFFVLTSHKIYGPTGVGVLYGKKAVLDSMPPYRGGGEMIDVVEKERVTYNELPHRFEAGTPPIIEAIALGTALEWMMEQDIKGLRTHEQEITDHAMEALRATNVVDLYGEATDKGPVIAFNIRGAHPHDVSTIMDRSGVAVRAGHHCAQPLMKHLGVSATARASFGAYNTHADVEALVEACAKAHNILG